MSQFIDPCTAAAAELAGLASSWSQARDKLQRWQWDNGCADAEPPSSTNWGRSVVPPLNPNFPGNPDDRESPNYGN